MAHPSFFTRMPVNRMTMRKVALFAALYGGVLGLPALLVARGAKAD